MQPARHKFGSRVDNVRLYLHRLQTCRSLQAFADVKTNFLLDQQLHQPQSGTPQGKRVLVPGRC